MKKALSVLLALVLVLGMFAGCGSQTAEEAKATKAPEVAATSGGGQEATEAPKELEHMEISIGYWGAEGALVGDPLLDEMEEKFNVEFVPYNFTWDDYGTKLKLWASTDSLPDVFATDNRTSSSFVKWAREGVIRSVPSDLSAYPNLEAYLDRSSIDSCKVDGEVYAIFRATYNDQYEAVLDRVIAYRWDLAQQAGITEEPKTWDEFRAMLRAIIAADPEGKKIGGMVTPDISYLNQVLMCYTVPRAIDSGGSFKWIEQDGSYIPAYFAGEELGSDVLPSFQLARDMFTEGTIDKDIALSSLEQSNNKFLNGQAAAVCTTMDTLGDTIYENWEALHGVPMEEQVKVMPLMPAVDGNTYYWAGADAWSESMFSANVDDEKMDRILMIYDWLLSDEGLTKSKYGVEGETFDIVDNTIVKRKDVVSPYKCQGVFACLVEWINPDVGGVNGPVTFKSQWPNDFKKEYAEAAKSVVLPDYVPECNTAFLTMGSDFGLHIGDDILLIMTGTEPVEDMWAQIIEDYKADGLEDVIAEVNAAMK